MKTRYFIYGAALFLLSCNESVTDSNEPVKNEEGTTLSKTAGTLVMTPTYSKGFPETVTLTGNYTDVASLPISVFYTINGIGQQYYTASNLNWIKFTGPENVEQKAFLSNISDKLGRTGDPVNLEFIDSRDFILPPVSRIITKNMGVKYVKGTSVLSVPGFHQTGHIDGKGIVDWFEGGSRILQGAKSLTLPDAVNDTYKIYKAVCKYSRHLSHEGISEVRTYDFSGKTIFPNYRFKVGTTGPITMPYPHRGGHADGSVSTVWSNGRYQTVSRDKYSYTPPVSNIAGSESYYVVCWYVYNDDNGYMKWESETSNTFTVTWYVPNPIEEPDPSTE